MSEFKGGDGTVRINDAGIELVYEPKFTAATRVHADKIVASPVRIGWRYVLGADFVQLTWPAPGYLRIRVRGVVEAPPDRDPLCLLAATPGNRKQLRAAAEAIAARTGHNVSGGPARPDIQAAASRMGYRFGSMREVKHLPEHLLPGEVVDFISGGRYGGDLGIVTLTDRRLLFLFHGVVRRRVEDFPLSKITSVLTKSRMMYGELLITCSGNSAKIDLMERAATDALAAGLRSRMSSGSAPVPMPGSPAQRAADPIEQLRALGQLRDAGVLSEAEFETKKAELLGRI